MSSYLFHYLKLYVSLTLQIRIDGKNEILEFGYSAPCDFVPIYRFDAECGYFLYTFMTQPLDLVSKTLDDLFRIFSDPDRVSESEWNACVKELFTIANDHPFFRLCLMLTARNYQKYANNQSVDPNEFIQLKDSFLKFQEHFNEAAESCFNVKTIKKARSTQYKQQFGELQRASYICRQGPNFEKLYIFQSLESIWSYYDECFLIGNYSFKKCLYCKKPFVVQNYAKTKYCRRKISANSHNTCKDVGSLKVHKQNQTIYRAI